MKNTKPRVKKAQWFPSISLKQDSLINIKKRRSSERHGRRTKAIRTIYKTQNRPQDADRIGDINRIRCKRTAWLLENRQHRNKIRVANSDPCLGTPNLKPTENSVQKNQHNDDKVNHLMNKRLTNIHLIKAPQTSKLTLKMAEGKRKKLMELDAGPDMTTLKCPYFINNQMPVYSSQNVYNLNRNTNGKKTSNLVILPELESPKYNFLDPFFEKSSSIEQVTKEQKSKTSINATVVEYFGEIYLKNAVKWNNGQENPQNVATYYQNDSSTRHELTTKNSVSIKSDTSYNERLLSNCTYQPADDRGMQLHRQTSYSTPKVLIGPYAQTYVVYNVNAQANAQMKEQGTSQQFKQKSQGIGSGSVSGNDSSSASSKRRAIKIESNVSFSVEFTDRGKSTGSETSTPEPAAEGKKKGKDKKELHRCMCTLSIPTDDKKLKNKPCDSGVCEPGKCTPSECFRRLQEKYGSKKSASDVSSSQASQTSKKKERAGKETLVKEKGSSSISKYKESTESKPLPEKEKEKEKFNIVKYVTNCCKKMQFWKKDKSIELKPAVIGTDISVKDDKDKTFGSNAATQSGKAKGKTKEKQKPTVKVKEEKKVEVKVTGKKGKKASKKEEVKTGTKASKKEEVKKGTKASKKEEVKKGTKASKKEEVKKETKATGVKTKKGRPLQPYECEPGVCTPKVCIPKECYERKFPPPPPKQGPPQSPFIICLRKLCCKKTVEPGGVSAATQARKGAAPDVPPGATVYKETGTGGKQRGKKGAVGTAVQQPAEAGDVSVDSRRTKKQTAYSGIQYFQTVDNDTMMQRQGLNIGSECSCSVEFYKMLY